MHVDRRVLLQARDRLDKKIQALNEQLRMPMTQHTNLMRMHEVRNEWDTAVRERELINAQLEEGNHA